MKSENKRLSERAEPIAETALPMIEVRDIDKRFNPASVNETVVFSQFSLTVRPGEFVSVVGSNGSGKTTLLNLIAGSIAPDAGQIFLRGADITGQPEFVRARRIGRVHQNPSLGVASSMTIAENMSLADNKGRRYGLTPGVSAARLDHYRTLAAGLGLGLEDKMQVRMGALSGGQRQALSLLMATMNDIDLLLLDEHTAALDPKTADLIMELTDRIVREKQLTALMVTHNLRYAVEYGSRLLMFHSGQAVLDAADEKKQECRVEDLLSLFNSISIECGN